MLSLSEYSKQVGIPEGVIKGRDKKPTIAIARQVYWYYLHCNGVSYYRMARMYGRTHTTILKGVATIKNLIETKDPLISPHMEFVHSFSQEAQII